MASGFSIDAIRNMPPMGKVKPSGVEKDVYGPTPYGVLLKEDKRMLEEYSGYKFDFPPAPGQAFPSSLVYIAQARGGEYQAGRGYSDLGSLIGQINTNYRRMSGADVISSDLIAFVAERNHVGGGSWSNYFQEKRSAGN